MFNSFSAKEKHLAISLYSAKLYNSFESKVKITNFSSNFGIRPTSPPPPPPCKTKAISVDFRRRHFVFSLDGEGATFQALREWGIHGWPILSLQRSLELRLLQGSLCNAVKKPSGENLFIEGLAKVKMIGSAST